MSGWEGDDRNAIQGDLEGILRLTGESVDGRPVEAAATGEHQGLGVAPQVAVDFDQGFVQLGVA